MAALTVSKLNDGAADLDTIAAVANSDAPTVVDRLGNVKSTLSGLRATVTDSGVAGKATLADLIADLQHAPDALAWVLNDAVPENNTQYRKFGAWGTGGWIVASASPVSALGEEVRLQAIQGDTYLLSNVDGVNEITGTCHDIGAADHGRKFLFRAVATVTAAATLSINDGAAYPIYDGYGGAISAGGIMNGYYYQVMFELPGNVWRILSYGSDHGYLYGLFSSLPAVTGTANAIMLQTIQYPTHGLMLSFVPIATNDGPVTINLRGGGELAVYKGLNSPLSGGELVQGFPALLVFDSQGSRWRLMANGVLASDVLAAAVGVAPLNQILVAQPYGAISFANGVRTTSPYRIVSTGTGSSVGMGAGATSAYAPNKMLVDRLTEELAGYGNCIFVDDNQSVGGQTLSEMMAQFNASTEPAKHIVTIVPGMNDFFPQNYNSGEGFAAQPGLLRALIAAIKKAGATPIVFTSPHPHPDRYQIGSLGENPMSYPFSTFNVTLPFVFNSANQTISAPNAFGTVEWGGPILKVGDAVRVYAGVNAGVHTITAISADRSTLTVGGTVVSSSSAPVLLRHINVDPEAVIVPPVSKSKILRDWSGSGIECVGDVRFWHGNAMIRDIVRATGAVLGDAEWAFFKYGVEVHGYDALYGIGQYNHPNPLGYDESYGRVIRSIARDISRQILNGDSRLYL